MKIQTRSCEPLSVAPRWVIRPRFPPIACALVVVLAVAALSATARAQPPAQPPQPTPPAQPTQPPQPTPPPTQPPEPTPAPEPVMVTDSFGGQIVLADFTSVALGAWLGPAFLALGYGFAAPIVHVAHHDSTGAVLSRRPRPPVITPLDAGPSRLSDRAAVAVS
jgi:hypothetical protein